MHHRGGLLIGTQLGVMWAHQISIAPSSSSVRPVFCWLPLFSLRIWSDGCKSGLWCEESAVEARGSNEQCDENNGGFIDIQCGAATAHTSERCCLLLQKHKSLTPRRSTDCRTAVGLAIRLAIWRVIKRRPSSVRRVPRWPLLLTNTPHPTANTPLSLFRVLASLNYTQHTHTPTG